MIPAIDSAASGIRLGLAMLDQAANSIAARSIEDQEHLAQPPSGVEPLEGRPATTPPVEGSLVDDLVATIIARHMVNLNSGALRRADATMGSLIDIVR